MLKQVWLNIQFEFEVFCLEIIIDSPMQPTLFKQKVKVNHSVQGYLSADKFYHLALGKHSFKCKFGTSIVSLNEDGKIDGKRYWLVNLQRDNGVKEQIGSMIMDSKVSDTIRDNASFYQVNFKNNHYTMKKPFMQFGKEEAFLYDSNDLLLANIFSSYKQKPRLKKCIYLNDNIEFNEEKIAFFIVSLNLAIFVS